MEANEYPRDELTDPLDWQKRAQCKNYPPSAFFPSDGAGVVAARIICEECAVKSPCLEYALANRIEHGVWGGKSERERRRILKSRRQQQE